MKIKISEIKNKQNMSITKSGETCSTELILRRVKTQKRGKKPTLYYKGKEVILDITKEDIERIIYCQHCGYQVNEDEWIRDSSCPHCNSNAHYGYEGFRIKNTLHYIYADFIWEKFPEEIKDRYRWILDI